MSCAVFEDEYYYICHDGRELRHMRTESRIQDGYTQTFEVYGCADCSGCEHKAKCLYKYDAEKHSDRNKVMKINERWEELKEETNENIQSEEGILKRQTRSIQTEGHFGDIKENENFRRFHYRCLLYTSQGLGRIMIDLRIGLALLKLAAADDQIKYGTHPRLLHDPGDQLRACGGGQGHLVAAFF